MPVDVRMFFAWLLVTVDIILLGTVYPESRCRKRARCVRVRARGRSTLVYESIGNISDIPLFIKDRGRDLNLVYNKVANGGGMVDSSLGQQLAFTAV